MLCGLLEENLLSSKASMVGLLGVLYASAMWWRKDLSNSMLECMIGNGRDDERV